MFDEEWVYVAEKALKFYADEDNWGFAGVGHGETAWSANWIDMLRSDRKPWEVAEKALKKWDDDDE